MMKKFNLKYKKFIIALLLSNSYSKEQNKNLFFNFDLSDGWADMRVGAPQGLFSSLFAAAQPGQVCAIGRTDGNPGNFVVFYTTGSDIVIGSTEGNAVKLITASSDEVAQMGKGSVMIPYGSKYISKPPIGQYSALTIDHDGNITTFSDGGGDKTGSLTAASNPGEFVSMGIGTGNSFSFTNNQSTINIQSVFPGSGINITTATSASSSSNSGNNPIMFSTYNDAGGVGGDIIMDLGGAVNGGHLQIFGGAEGISLPAIGSGKYANINIDENGYLTTNGGGGGDVTGDISCTSLTSSGLITGSAGLSVSGGPIDMNTFSQDERFGISLMTGGQVSLSDITTGNISLSTAIKMIGTGFTGESGRIELRTSTQGDGLVSGDILLNTSNVASGPNGQAGSIRLFLDGAYTKGHLQLPQGSADITLPTSGNYNNLTIDTLGNISTENPTSLITRSLTTTGEITGFNGLNIYGNVLLDASSSNTNQAESITLTTENISNEGGPAGDILLKAASQYGVAGNIIIDINGSAKGDIKLVSGTNKIVLPNDDNVHHGIAIDSSGVLSTEHDDFSLKKISGRPGSLLFSIADGPNKITLKSEIETDSLKIEGPIAGIDMFSHGNNMTLNTSKENNIGGDVYFDVRGTTKGRIQIIEGSRDIELEADSYRSLSIDGQGYITTTNPSEIHTNTIDATGLITGSNGLKIDSGETSLKDLKVNGQLNVVGSEYIDLNASNTSSAAGSNGGNIVLQTKSLSSGTDTTNPDKSGNITLNTVASGGYGADVNTKAGDITMYTRTYNAKGDAGDFSVFADSQAGSTGIGKGGNIWLNTNSDSLGAAGNIFLEAANTNADGANGGNIAFNATSSHGQGGNATFNLGGKTQSGKFEVYSGSMRLITTNYHSTPGSNGGTIYFETKSDSLSTSTTNPDKSGDIIFNTSAFDTDINGTTKGGDVIIEAQTYNGKGNAGSFIVSTEASSFNTLAIAEAGLIHLNASSKTLGKAGDILLEAKNTNTTGGKGGSIILNTSSANGIAGDINIDLNGLTQGDLKFINGSKSIDKAESGKYLSLYIDSDGILTTNGNNGTVHGRFADIHCYGAITFPGFFEQDTGYHTTLDINSNGYGGTCGIINLNVNNDFSESTLGGIINLNAHNQNRSGGIISLDAGSEGNWGGEILLSTKSKSTTFGGGGSISLDATGIGEGGRISIDTSSTEGPAGEINIMAKGEIGGKINIRSEGIPTQAGEGVSLPGSINLDTSSSQKGGNINLDTSATQQGGNINLDTSSSQQGGSIFLNSQSVDQAGGHIYLKTSSDSPNTITNSSALNSFNSVNGTQSGHIVFDTSSKVNGGHIILSTEGGTGSSGDVTIKTNALAGSGGKSGNIVFNLGDGAFYLHGGGKHIILPPEGARNYLLVDHNGAVVAFDDHSQVAASSILHDIQTFFGDLKFFIDLFLEGVGDKTSRSQLTKKEKSRLNNLNTYFNNIENKSEKEIIVKKMIETFIYLILTHKENETKLEESKLEVKEIKKELILINEKYVELMKKYDELMKHI